MTTVRLTNGDMVFAGETTFSVQIVDDQPEPPPPVAAAPAVPSTPQEKLIALLRAEFQPLYALLDAAHEPSVLKVLLEFKEEYQSLFEGPQGAQAGAFCALSGAPAAELAADRDTGTTGLGQELGCVPGQPGAIGRPAAALSSIPDGKTAGPEAGLLSLRPSMSPAALLPTCTAQEISLLFGPVKYYIMEDEKPDLLLRFSNKGVGVGRRTLPLAVAGDTASASHSSIPNQAQ